MNMYKMYIHVHAMHCIVVHRYMCTCIGMLTLDPTPMHIANLFFFIYECVIKCWL